MKRLFFGERKHIDVEKAERRADAKTALNIVLETGDESKYTEIVKRLKPNMTPAELVRLIEIFREERKGRLQHPGGS